MKKQLFTLGLMLAASLTLTNCAEPVENQFEDAKNSFEVFATTAQTKTANDGMNTVWSDNDSIAVFHAEAGKSTYTKDGKFVVADMTTGRFTGELGASLTSGKSYDWFFFYPYAAKLQYLDNSVDGAEGHAFYTYIGAGKGKSQKQTGNSSMAHISGGDLPLYGVAKRVAMGTAPAAQMQNLASVIAVNVTNNSGAAATIKNVSFTATEPIQGTFYIDYTGTAPVYTCNPNYAGNTAAVEITDGESIAVNGSATFYMAVKPFTAKSGTKLSVNVTAVDGKTYAKEITLSADANFEAGKIQTINVAYAPSTVEFKTLAQIIAANSSLAKNAVSTEEYNVKNVTVMAMSGTNLIIDDGTASMVYFASSTTGLAVGKKMDIKGKVKNYYYTLEIVDNTFFNATDVTVNYPTPTDFDSDAFKAVYTANQIVTNSYVKAEGALGTDGKTLSIDGMTATLNLYTTYSDLKEKTVTVYGYPLGVSSKGTINFLPVKVEETGEPVVVTKTFALKAESVEVAPTATSAKMAVEGNASFTVNCPEGVTADPATFEGAEKSVVTNVILSFAANATTSPKTYDITVTTTDDVEGEKTLTFTVNHKANKNIAGDAHKDILDHDAVGVWGSSYTNWGPKAGPSGATYAGQTSGGNKNDVIQMKSNDSTSGIVVTSATKYVKSVTVTWTADNTAGRQVDIFGNMDAFAAATELYNITGTNVKKLGSLEFDANKLTQTYTLDKNYHYVGIRSNKGALYLTEVQIEWSDSKVGDDPVADLPKLTTPSVTCTAHTETTLTFSWEAVENASKYSVKVGSGETVEVTETSYTATGLTANTSYTCTVKAIASDPTTHHDSNTGSCTASTDAAAGALTATFDFTDYASFGFEEKAATSNGLVLDGGSYERGPITLTTTAGSNPTYIWSKTDDTTELRFYKASSAEGSLPGTLTFTAATGKNIKEISITGSKVKIVAMDGYDSSTKKWTGSANSVTFTASDTNYITKIVVTYE